MIAYAESASTLSPTSDSTSAHCGNFWSLTVDGLSYGAIYALVAIGYTLVYGVLRLINFAHSEVFMLGMFGQYAALLMLGFSPQPDAYNFGVLQTTGFLLLAGLVGMAVSGTAAVGVEFIAYRPLRRRNAKPLAFLITAIGMSFVLQELVHYVLPKVPTQTPLGGSSAQPVIKLVDEHTQFSFWGATVTNVTLIVVISALILTAGTDFLVNKTRLGRGIRSVAQDPDAALLMGVSRERIISITFLIGGVLAGAAALLYTLKIPSAIVYSGGFILGIKAFCAAVLGGIGNIRGALLGGLLLGVMENYGSVVFGNQWKDVVAFALLILVLMFRPTGILGEKLGKARV
ncbi:MAG: branched-chain amino acid ABC transporter permease [Gordonia sp. (in: high G+C Gram-positive bacteria)]